MRKHLGDDQSPGGNQPPALGAPARQTLEALNIPLSIAKLSGATGSSAGQVLLMSGAKNLSFWRDYRKEISTHANFLAAVVAGIGVSHMPR